MNESPEKPIKHGMIECAVVTIISGIVEIAIFVVQDDKVSLAQRFMYHGLLSSLLMIWLYTRQRRQLDIRTALILVLCTSVLGPFGVIGSGLMLLFIAGSRSNAENFDTWYLALFPEQINEKTWLSDLPEAAQKMNPMDLSNTVSSFSDILRFGSFPEKQEVISRLTRGYSPEFAPTIKTALTSDDASVRVQAATAVAQIEKIFTQKWLTLKQTSEQNPDCFDSFHAIAEHLYNYANSGLLELEQKHDILKNALSNYQECQAIKPAAINIKLAISHIFMQQGKPDQAIELLYEIRGKIQSSWEIHTYCDCLYQLQRFDELRHELTEWKYWRFYGNKLMPPLEDAVHLWTNPAEDRPWLPPL